MKFKSIAMRIFVLVIPTIVITTLSFVVLSYHISNSRINETINEKMYESLIAADLEIQLELYKNSVVAIDFARYAKSIGIDSFDDEFNKNFLAENIFSNNNTFAGGVWFEPYAFDSSSYYFGSYLYVDDYGKGIYIPRYGDYVNYYDEDWYIKGSKSNNEVVWSTVYYDPVSAKVMVTAIKPFYDDGGKFLGVGTADMDLANIQNIVNNISIGETGKAFIIGAKGEYLSFFDENKRVSDMIWEDEDEELARLGDELMNSSSGTTSLVKDGNILRVYYMTMDNVDWTLAITFEESEISQSTFDAFVIMTVIPIIGLILVMFGIYMVARYIRKVVNKVNSFADLAASGDLSKKIDVTEIDEFGFMEQRLNAMISNMNEMSNHSAELLKVAEKASNSKSEFLSRMSHEIRTPMNAIIGMTQIAKASDNDVKIRDCLDKIDNASKHLLALINDILDISKIEADKLELVEEEFSLNQVTSNVYTMMLVKAEEKNQQLILNLAKNVPMYIISDELRFAQVLTNLISNAVKFTPENGTIVIDINESYKYDNYAVISVSVKDSGIGLSQEQQSRLFRLFEQGDGSISRRFGGTGLGLAISKRIVELMGGSILVESKPDKGSIFTFTMRARIGTGNTINAKKQSDMQSIDKMKSLKILVVDDSDEANEYMKHVLKSLNFDCDNVHNGEEALEAVSKSTANNQYDIIFMDYIMPKLNGIETAKKIKEISDESVAIIMVSIYDWKDIEEEAAEAGISKHITKPFSPSCVLDVINEVLFGTVRCESYKSSSSILDFSRNTILLAEDIDINREILESLLEQTGVKIEVAENGIQVVEMFQAEPDKYDLILMDIQMPRMGGYEATRQIRNMDIKKAKTIPIIAMTANALSEDVKKCIESGMNDHLSKPIETEILLFKLNDYFFMKDYLNYDIW